jgi:hypothetical protein
MNSACSMLLNHCRDFNVFFQQTNREGWFVPFNSSSSWFLKIFRRRVCPLSESESLYGWQSASPYVLVSSPLCGRLNMYCFLFKSLGLKFVVLSLWGALSDERSGLSLVRVRVRVTLRLTVSQSVSMSWRRAHFADVWPVIASFSSIWVWSESESLYGWESVSESVSKYVLVSSPFCGRLTR